MLFPHSTIINFKLNIYARIHKTKGCIITYALIHTIHIFSVFIYGGFLFVDVLFLSKMRQTLTTDENTKAREAIMIHVRKVVPYALMIAVASGLYLISQTFGVIENGKMSNFQILLSIKAFLALWLGLRGINQKLFKIQPFLFKSHLFPFSLVVIIILLSQFMFIF